MRRCAGRNIWIGSYFARIIAAPALLLGTALPASAILIDDFSSPAGGQAICAGTCGGAPSTSSMAVTGVLGGERDMRVFRIAGGGRVDANANAFDIGELVFGAVSAAGSLFLQYDGADGDPAALNFGLGGGAGLSIVGETAIRYRLTSDIDTGGTATFRLYTSAGNFISFTDTLTPLTPAQTRELPFAGFATTGVFDPSAVRAIDVTIVGNTNLDLTIDFIETYRGTVVTTLVAPNSGALFAGALVLIGLAAPLNGRRRARRA